MRFTVAALRERGVADGADLRLAGAQHEVRDRPTAATASSARPSSARTGRCSATTAVEPLAEGAGAVSAPKPKLAVWKFASCDGCQLSLLDCEDELLALAGAVEIAYFLEARRQTVRGPVRPVARRGLDHHARRRRAHPARCARQSRRLVTIGACATAGGIQALRNFADVDDFMSVVYATPGVHLDARDLDADLRPRARRLRAAGLPDQQAPAARGDQRLPQRAPAGDRRRTASAWSASGAATSA